MGKYGRGWKRRGDNGKEKRIGITWERERKRKNGAERGGKVEGKAGG